MYNIFLKLQLAGTDNRIKKKTTLTVEDHVMLAQLVLMALGIKEKKTLTVEDHVLRAPPAKIIFRIKEN